ncbi:MAG: lysophospholipid acyltransferase family protein [Terrimicrobiaceae bacterium]
MVESKTAGPRAASAGVTFRQHLEYSGLCLAGWVVRGLPFLWLAKAAKPLGAIVFYFDRRGREVAMQNLDAAFGGSRSPSEKRRIAKSSYQTFARTMLELFWSPNLTEAVARKYFATRGLPGTPGQPCIIVSLHSSNYEWLGQNTSFFCGPGIIIAQKLKNPLLGAYFDKLRGSTGHQIIPQERAVALMLKRLKAGGYFCAAVDLNLDPKEASVIIDEFSGLKTCVTKIHAALALHTGAKIVPAECQPRADGGYDMIYHKPLEYPPNATPDEIAQLCWDALEPRIREHPETWLWSYKHWRFRPVVPDSSRYPRYSNTAKRFDRKMECAQSAEARKLVLNS